MIRSFDIRTEPHDIQTLVVKKFQGLRIGGLYMEMGTGKSLATILLLAERQTKISRVFWCCPCSVKSTIKYELLKHTNIAEEDICFFGEGKIKGPALWNIVGLESISGSYRLRDDITSAVDANTALVVDESSLIKGYRSARTRFLCFIGAKVRYRYILDGTGMSQGIEDIYSQMLFLDQRILGYCSYLQFLRAHIKFSERYKGMIVDRRKVDLISRRISPYVFQAKKSDCCALPEKIYTSRECSLSYVQWEAYQIAKQEFYTTVMDESPESSGIAVYKLFSALQSISCGLLPKSHARIAHNKITLLKQVLSQIFDSHVIIWAKYRGCVKEISEALIEYERPIFCFYGAVPMAERNSALEKWKEQGGYLIATQATGGRGLTLNEAHTVLFYANSFSYGQRAQSEDRCHRIGQTHAVQYIDLWTDCNIDRRIQSALSKKTDLVNEFQKEMIAARTKQAKIKLLRRI